MASGIVVLGHSEETQGDHCAEEQAENHTHRIVEGTLVTIDPTKRKREREILNDPSIVQNFFVV